MRKSRLENRLRLRFRLRKSLNLSLSLSLLWASTLALTLTFLFGCGQVEQKETAPVSISFKIPSANQKVLQAAVPTGITSITLEVTATDMQDIVMEVGATEGQTVTIDLEVPSGPLREFKARAFNNDNTVIYEGKTTADLDAGVATTVQIDMIPLNPLVGTWGYGRLRHNNDGTWHAKNGKITYNNDGTGTDVYQYNDNGTLGSNTESFTYTTISNQDGSLAATYTYPDSTTKTRKYVLSDDGKMMLLDGTDESDKQRLRIAVKLDTSKVYTNSDFSGDYYAIGYGYHSSTAPPAGNRAISAVGTPNGFGNMTSSGTMNINGTLTTFSGSGTYTANTDGSVTMDNGFKGYLTGDGAGLVGGHPTVTNIWTIGLNLKKQDRVYSTADLAGTWATAAFGDDNGTSFIASFGTMTCDSNGNCTATIKDQVDGITSVTTEIVGPSTVSADGSFGSSIFSGGPTYAGAIGNNGNTIIMNDSFGLPSFRYIIIGVRCSTCSNLAGP